MKQEENLYFEMQQTRKIKTLKQNRPMTQEDLNKFNLSSKFSGRKINLLEKSLAS
jgi:hypothetical protein